MQKAQTQIHQTVNGVIHEDGTVVPDATEDDQASTRGILSVPHTPNINGNLTAEDSIPVLRFSTESDRSMDESGVAKDGEEEGTFVESNSLGLEKPTPTQAASEKSEEETQASSSENFSFSNKRLCDRWLDNLFMVLYEVHRLFYVLSLHSLTSYHSTSESGRSSVPK